MQRGIQWNLSVVDTLGTAEGVLIRCPHLRGVLIEGLLCKAGNSCTNIALFPALNVAPCNIKSWVWSGNETILYTLMLPMLNLNSCHSIAIPILTLQSSLKYTCS